MLLRVAQYVRMSTEHQQYSTENQADMIARYAESHQMVIVKTYADHGRSGLSLAGREGLTQLLRDVEIGAADFSAIATSGPAGMKCRPCMVRST